MPSLLEQCGVNRSIELKESFDGNLLLANLYLKINDKDSAIQYARIAKGICTGLGCNSKDIDALFIELAIK